MWPALAALVSLVAGLVLMTVPAGAEPAVVTEDFASYPTAAHPEDCPDGPEALVGESFTNLTTGQTGPELWSLTLSFGDTVVMNWDGFADGCTDAEGNPLIDVGLATYESVTAQFNPSENEYLIGWESCGVSGPACVTEGGSYSLSAVIPTAEETCAVQVDAFLGQPLGIIGIDGSFYTDVTRQNVFGEAHGPNNLVSAKHFGEDCVGEDRNPTTTTTAPPTTTTAPPTTTTPDVGDEGDEGVEAPATTVPAPTTTTTEAPAEVEDDNDDTEVLSNNVTNPTLPRTGASTTPLVGGGLVLLAAGLGALTISRRIRTA